MTLEQLILGISTSWDTACCLLIVPPHPPPGKHTHKHTPLRWPAEPPSPPPVCVCVCLHAQGHKVYGMYSRSMCGESALKQKQAAIRPSRDILLHLLLHPLSCKHAASQACTVEHAKLYKENNSELPFNVFF